MYSFVDNYTCALKIGVYTNSSGNILQDGETPAGTKIFTYKNISSTITADETVNDTNSPAVHNGAAAFVWLFSGIDTNFNVYVQKNSVAVIDDE